MSYTDISLRGSRSRAIRDRTSSRSIEDTFVKPTCQELRDFVIDLALRSDTLTIHRAQMRTRKCISLLPAAPRPQLRVMLAVPTLGERGCGRTLGGIRVLVCLLVVPPPYHREVGHLEGVGLLTAALQRTRHTVSHVEVARRDV